MTFLQERLPGMVTLVGTVLAGFVGLLVTWGAKSPWSWGADAKAGLDLAPGLETLIGLLAVIFGFIVVAAVAVLLGAGANLVLRQRVAVIGGLLVAATFFAVMAQAIMATAAWDAEGAGMIEGFGPITDGLFDTHVLAFEVLGILLTAAMIGAMVIARPLGVAADSENYATKIDDDAVEVLQKISDVDANMEGTA